MSHLRWLLNLGAVLAIAQAVVKALEIVLDTRQKLAFQHATENLALKLIDLDPIRHYHRLSDKKVQLKWLIGIVLVVWTLGIYFTLEEWNFSFSEWWSGVHGWLIAYFFLIPVVLYLPFRVVLSWFARSKNVWRMLFKAVALASPVAVTVVASEMYGETLIPLVLPAAWILGTFICCAAIVALLYTAQAAVWVFRHLIWRIATDAKGAWSAALFVLAAILALAAALVPKS